MLAKSGFFCVVLASIRINVPLGTGLRTRLLGGLWQTRKGED